MKKLLLSLMVAAVGFAANAQDLAPDQNPNYKVSMDKYTATHTALQATNNTTLQNTYKAYDWSTAKTERRTERRNDRREMRLFNRYNNYNNYDYNGYNDNYYYNNNNNYNNYRPYQYRNNNRWRWHW